jgi:hypothetical protein
MHGTFWAVKVSAFEMMLFSLSAHSRKISQYYLCGKANNSMQQIWVTRQLNQVIQYEKLQNKNEYVSRYIEVPAFVRSI